jgi:hypothetical protein
MTTAVEILIERRRLGQTKLDVSPSLVNKINATSPSNLGNFDYAHLRVPLPKDLEGSGIFFAQHNSMYPESYFLMVCTFPTSGCAWAKKGRKANGTAATKQRWLHERNWHVQGCIPLGLKGGRSQRAHTSQETFLFRSR